MRQPLGASLIMPRVRNRQPEGVHVGPPLLFAAKVSRLRCTTGEPWRRVSEIVRGSV